ncbi:hypothetical protein AC1031_013990 [Aphanomyces cochlioides]|nr:hypothetical protein AC1031_013990 [Aphanomyces cochlioides]
MIAHQNATFKLQLCLDVGSSFHKEQEPNTQISHNKISQSRDQNGNHAIQMWTEKFSRVDSMPRFWCHCCFERVLLSDAYCTILTVLGKTELSFLRRLDGI